ncbi:hypothetical protein G3I59_47245 [Amycolatopsis rubida]|uniref:WXG100 family type VII secretion target n=1 Tax=Amycolatopsis rubida TaxID=112413 RepID=A0ABX0C5H6_9PSEU|nr:MULTISPECIES: hypothetical protein [Amycolatopsis]MYW98006.1 hypothetical protein [Amycolatopsis rubida]NEC62991.1 hypothetical protein [Amycolatopsis rubida]OAP24490.1 hypothetical protein A4R44_04881 [Amycolatopsis sp. M39]
MDIPSEIGALAALATQTTFSTLTTAAWSDFRAWLGRWSSRSNDETAGKALATLDTNVEQLLEADEEDRPVLERAVQKRWTQDLTGLLTAHPDLTEQLREFLNEWIAANPSTAPTLKNHQQVAYGFDNSQIVQNVGTQNNTFGNAR